jgi:hypothetical protein
MDKQSKTNVDELIKSFISKRSDRPILFEEVNSFIHNEFSNQQIASTNLHQLLTFAAEQQGMWQCKWLFSPISNSDIDARNNMECYSILWKTFADSLVKIVPDIDRVIGEERKLLNLKYSLERRVEETKNRPILTSWNVVLSKLSFFFNSIGFKNLAERLYAIALFPSGSVGREQ